VRYCALYSFALCLLSSFPPPILASEGGKEIDGHAQIYSNFDFAFHFLEKIPPDNHNVSFSPVGLSSSILIFGLGSSGDSRKQIFETLGVENIAPHILEYRSQLKELVLDTPDFSSFLAVASSKVNFKPVYKKAMERDFGVSFIKSNLDSINRWAMSQLSGIFGHALHIIDPHGPSVCIVNSYANFCPVSQSSSEYSFELLPFSTLEGQMIKTQYINYQDDIHYINADDFEVASLKSPQSSLTLFIFLPHKSSNIVKLEGRFNSQFFNSILEELNQKIPQKFQVFLPVVNVISRIDAEKSFKHMGVLDLFSSNNSNFPKISDRDFSLSFIRHSSAISIGGDLAPPNRVGDGEAVSPWKLTSFFKKSNEALGGDEPKGLLSPLSFHVDRPFFYVLTDNSKNIVSMGRIVNPSR